MTIEVKNDIEAFRAAVDNVNNFFTPGEESDDITTRKSLISKSIWWRKHFISQAV